MHTESQIFLTLHPQSQTFIRISLHWDSAVMCTWQVPLAYTTHGLMKTPNLV